MAAMLYLFPTEIEAAPFRAVMPQAQVRITGVGMASASAAVSRIIVQEQPSRLILCGIAGVCGESLQIGQVVEVVEDMEAGLPSQYALKYTPCRCTSLQTVRAYTVSRCGAALECSRNDESVAAIEQMEGAAVGAMCREWGVEYSHIRAISNRVGDSRALWQSDEAAKHLAEALVAQIGK